MTPPDHVNANPRWRLSGRVSFTSALNGRWLFLAMIICRGLESRHPASEFPRSTPHNLVTCLAYFPCIHCSKCMLRFTRWASPELLTGLRPRVRRPRVDTVSDLYAGSWNHSKSACFSDLSVSDDIIHSSHHTNSVQGQAREDAEWVRKENVISCEETIAEFERSL